MHVINKSEQNKILREAQTGNLAVIQDLKERYPEVHWCQLRYEKTGDTILHAAARLGHTHIIDYLLNNFVPAVVDCKNNDNKVPLHGAAQFSQHDAAKCLLAHGADVNALKRADWTPLMLACTKTQGEPSLKTVQLLLENGALIDYKNKDGWTALHLISREGDVDILNLLIRHKIDEFKRSNNGRTALHTASLHGNLEIVKVLSNLGLDVNCTDNCGNTPLHEAVLGGHINTCDYLIERGGNISAANKCGFSLLHLAAGIGHLKVINYLAIDLKLNCNSQSVCGYTPLHCAARKHLVNAVNLLVTLGADIKVKDNFGRVAHDYLNT